MIGTSPMHRGFLLVLEGVDGSGKTTLARGLAAQLTARGREVVCTREPTNGPFGQRIRALAATGRGAVTAEAEFQLFHEDRKAHVAEVVRPALARGAVVIQDRSYFSTVAYQGERGLDRDRLLRESEAIAPRPDLLLVVDVPANVAVERIKKSRGAGQDDFEAEQALDRIRRVFLAFPEAAIVDGQAAPEVVLAASLAKVDAVMGAG